jgi:hypothetical protein
MPIHPTQERPNNNNWIGKEDHRKNETQTGIGDEANARLQTQNGESQNKKWEKGTKASGDEAKRQGSWRFRQSSKTRERKKEEEGKLADEQQALEEKLKQTKLYEEGQSKRKLEAEKAKKLALNKKLEEDNPKRKKEEESNAEAALKLQKQQQEYELKRREMEKKDELLK